MLVRSLLLSACLLGTAVYTAVALDAEVPPLVEPLDRLPRVIDRWQGRDEPAFAPAILKALGVDHYVNRIYEAPGEPFVSLYVGYYETQREGDTMHSPLNCLPGAGWQPMVTGRIDLRVPGRVEPVRINRIVVQKGLDRAAVLYWYQSHGRVVASEYAGKLYLIYDAVRLNRSNGALVRVVSPVASDESGTTRAERRATSFAQAAFPHLDRHLP